MIKDFTESELDTVQELSQQKFRKDIELHRADAERRPNKDSPELTECAAALLQTQADHERETRGVTSGSTGENLA